MGITCSNTCCSTSEAPGKDLFKRNMEKRSVLLVYYESPPSPPRASVIRTQRNKAVVVKNFVGRSHGFMLTILCSCSQQPRPVLHLFTSQAFCLIALLSIFLGDGDLGGVCPGEEVWVREEESLLWCAVWGTLCSQGGDHLPCTCSCLLPHSSTVRCCASIGP